MRITDLDSLLEQEMQDQNPALAARNARTSAMDVQQDQAAERQRIREKIRLKRKELLGLQRQLSQI